MQSLLPLIPLLPFAGFLINGLFGRRLPKTAVGLIGSGAILGAFLLSVAVFSSVRDGAAIQQTLLPAWAFSYTCIPSDICTMTRASGSFLPT